MQVWYGMFYNSSTDERTVATRLQGIYEINVQTVDYKCLWYYLLGYIPLSRVFINLHNKIIHGSLEMSPRSFNRRVKLFNQTLAARVKQIYGVYFFRQAINHPRFICGDGCHLTDEGVAL